MPKAEKDIQALTHAVILLLFVFIMGVLGYASIEGYSFVEAFYMTVITVSTVGFKEVKNLSEAGMLFTVILILLSFGTFAYAATTFTGMLLDGRLKRIVDNFQQKKRMRRMNQHVVVCGYGRNGKQAVQDLIDHQEQVVVVERDTSLALPEHAQSPYVVWVEGDATLDEVMERAALEKAKALITTLPDDASNLLVVLTARGLNAKLKIISRATAENADNKLRKAGADNVIMPDRVGGARMARLVAQEEVVEFVEALLLRDKENVNLEEIDCNLLDSCFLNKTIGELNIRRISGANLIGMKTPDGKIIFNPAADTRLISDAKIFALGTPGQIQTLRKVLTGKKKP